MTNDKLSLEEKLKWTLPQKIDHSLLIIENALKFSDGNAYVSFSGGKDSTILLFLVKLIKPDIKAVFFNTTNEYPEIYRFIKEFDVIKIQPTRNIKQVIERVGFPLISKEQSYLIHIARVTKSEKILESKLHNPNRHFRISDKWKHLLSAPFEISDACCYHLKKRPASVFQKQNKLLPFIGTSVNESNQRYASYLKNGGCNTFKMVNPKSFPLSIWNDSDKWNFINENKLPYCSLYDQGLERTGCMICGFGCQYDNRFLFLKRLHPKAFEIGMNYKNKNTTYKEAIEFTLKKEMAESNQLSIWTKHELYKGKI